jgi:hypothetical protein
MPQRNTLQRASHILKLRRDLIIFRGILVALFGPESSVFSVAVEKHKN